MDGSNGALTSAVCLTILIYKFQLKKKKKKKHSTPKTEKKEQIDHRTCVSDFVVSFLSFEWPFLNDHQFSNNWINSFLAARSIECSNIRPTTWYACSTNWSTSITGNMCKVSKYAQPVNQMPWNSRESANEIVLKCHVHRCSSILDQMQVFFAHLKEKIVFQKLPNFFGWLKKNFLSKKNSKRRNILNVCTI